MFTTLLLCSQFNLQLYRPQQNMNVRVTHCIRTSNHMFKREIWDKFNEFSFLESPESNKHVIPG